MCMCMHAMSTLSSARPAGTAAPPQVLCVHDEGGLVVVKVYFKRGDLPMTEIARHKARSVRPLLAQRRRALPSPS